MIPRARNELKKLLQMAFVLFGFTLVLGLASMQWWDEALASYFADPARLGLWQLARDITEIGLGQHYFIFVTIMAIALWLIAPKIKYWIKFKKHIRWLKAWTINFFLALLFSGFWLHVFKWAFGRKRPHIQPLFNAKEFYPFTHNWDYQSLPSGHAQVLFTVATMLFVLAPKGGRFWFKLAGFFAFTRVVVYAHFLSDVIFGAYVGAISTLVLLYMMKKTKFGITERLGDLK